MKVKINIDFTCGGIYTDEFLKKNKDFVKEWHLTDKLPSENLIKPLFDGKGWIEGISEQELQERENARIEQLNIEYTEKISNLVDKYVQKYIIDGTEIPQVYKDAINNHSKYFYATFYALLWVMGWICSSNTTSLFFRISVGLLQEISLFVILCKLTNMNMAEWGTFEHLGFWSTVVFTILSVKYMNRINTLILSKIPKNET